MPVEEENFTELVEKIADNKDKKLVVNCANFDCDASIMAVKNLKRTALPIFLNMRAVRKTGMLTATMITAGVRDKPFNHERARDFLAILLLRQQRFNVLKWYRFAIKETLVIIAFQ